MSMISAQIDELRKLAMAFPDTSPRAALLRDAADTIWQLRDDLQRANDAVRDAEHDESRAWDRVHKAEAESDRLRSCLSDDAENARQIMGENRALKAENAKLRKLVRTIYMCSCIQCDRCDYMHGDSCAFDAESELRELGVEVDG